MKKLVSLILSLCILVSICSVAFGTVGAASVTVADTSAKLATNIQDGQILQCWNWSFNNIKNNMAKIAEQGFSAIQTSPIQGSKESTKEYYSTMQNSWWVYYQPINFSIENNSYNALGTKSEFKAMCDEAEKYGIKVIVDAVLNHTANNNTGNTVSYMVPDDLKNDSSCWHDISKNSWYESRWDITQFCMEGIPDLNTGNSKVQNYAINFLKECIDCGADGFRFDGAKHIEVPSDYDYASNFWPNVLNAATSYAKSTKGFTPYYYGEILDGPSGSNDRSNAQRALDSYMSYMSVTQSSVSNSIRNAVNGNNASGAIRSDFYFDDGSNAKGNKSVLWNESHDTYIHGGSGGIGTTNMNKTWALVGSRAEAAGMYMARPSSNSEKLGSAGITAWANKEVKAVNEFKNSFIGQSEYLSSSGSIAYNERGTTGAVLVNCGGTSTYADVKANRLSDGTYTDAVTGNKFTVSYGYIKGNIGSTGVAVITKDGQVAPTEATKAPETTKPTEASTPASSVTIYFDNSSYNWSSVYAYVYSDASSTQNANWPGKKMTLDSKTGYYKYTVPASLANGRVIFTESSDATTNRYPADQQAGLAISGASKIFKANHSWTKYTAPTTSTGTLTKLNKTSATIAYGKTTTAKATITGGTVTWKSSNTSVATVAVKTKTDTSSTVTITAKKPGTATITCTHSNGTSKTIKVTVTTAGLTLDKSSVSVIAGKTATAKAKFKAGTTTWKSNDTSIATVAIKSKSSTSTTVTITGKKIGTTTLTCTHADGTTATLEVVVTSAQLKLDKTSVDIYYGKTATAKASYKAGTVTWKSEDTSIASVAVKTTTSVSQTVTITAKKVGTTNIVCTHSDGTTKTLKVTVNSAGLTLNKTTASIYFGKTTTAKASYKAGTVTWKSSDPSIVSVDIKTKTSVSETVTLTAKKVGTATITCTHADGTSKTIKVTVNSAALTLSKTDVSLKVSKTTTAKASYKAGTVTWKSSDPSVATVTIKKTTSVSETVTLTGVKAGTATITCTHADGTSKTIEVTVK